MNILDPKTFIACDIVAAILLLAAYYGFKRRADVRKYKLAQENRVPLSEASFCKRLSIDEDSFTIVTTVREGLSKRGRFNPNQIYPEDDLWKTFDFQLDDFLDEFVKEYFYAQYEYLPSEGLKCVGDLVKFLIQIHAEAKRADSK